MMIMHHAIKPFKCCVPLPALTLLRQMVCTAITARCSRSMPCTALLKASLSRSPLRLSRHARWIRSAARCCAESGKVASMWAAEA